MSTAVSDEVSSPSSPPSPSEAELGTEEDARAAVEAIALPTPNARQAIDHSGDREFERLFPDWREVERDEMLRAGVPYMHRNGAYVSIRLTGVPKDTKHTAADSRRWVKQ